MIRTWDRLVQELKEKGNECTKAGKYAEAIFHYTHALKLDQKNAALYSNRSLAFLKMQQYYLALQDAMAAIRIHPEWPKGYFRRGEVEFATFHFTEALHSYRLALKFQGGEDPGLEDVIQRTIKERNKDRRADIQVPWLSAAIGIVMGVTIVIGDHVIPQKSSMPNPVMKTLFTMLVAMIGYGLGVIYRHYVRFQRASFLQPPVDLLGDEEATEKEAENEGNDQVPEKDGETGQTKPKPRQRARKGKR